MSNAPLDALSIGGTLAPMYLDDAMSIWKTHCLTLTVLGVVAAVTYISGKMMVLDGGVTTVKDGPTLRRVVCIKVCQMYVQVTTILLRLLHLFLVIAIMRIATT